MQWNHISVALNNVEQSDNSTDTNPQKRCLKLIYFVLRDMLKLSKLGCAQMFGELFTVIFNNQLMAPSREVLCHTNQTNNNGRM